MFAVFGTGTIAPYKRQIVNGLCPGGYSSGNIRSGGNCLGGMVRGGSCPGG